MSRQRIEWFACLVVCCSLIGCGQPTKRLNAPPQGQSDKACEIQPFFAYMVDSAMLSDLSVADIHFVPHTTELNSLGTTRLSRIAKLLGTYGGTVRYATHYDEDEEEFVNERLDHLRGFLATTGIDMSRVEVKVAMAGADHALAAEAIATQKKGLDWSESMQELWFPPKEDQD
jgi:hypothetical protein